MAMRTVAGTCTNTVKGADCSGDQEPSSTCAPRPRAVYDLELGPAVLAPGGCGKSTAPVRRHDAHYGKGTRHAPAQRPTAPAHAMLHTMYGLRCAGLQFFIDLRHRSDHGRGRPLARTWSPQSRRRHHPFFGPTMTILATALCRAYFSCTCADLQPATATRWCCSPSCRCRTCEVLHSIRPHLRRACPDHRSRAREGATRQLSGRALHGALRRHSARISALRDSSRAP